MNREDFRRRAAAARAVPLERVLVFRGAKRDRPDRAKWHTEHGPLSVTGPKFINWRGDQGGGGAKAHRASPDANGEPRIPRKTDQSDG